MSKQEEELEHLSKLFKLKKALEAMIPEIANEDKGDRTRVELRDHLNYMDELDATINKLKSKYEDSDE